MTLFHFANCVVLAYVPYFIAYKYSSLSDYASVWKCSQASLIYFITQFIKMLAVATFFPASESVNYVENFSYSYEIIKSTVDIIDVIGIHLAITSFISGKGEIRFFIVGLGWSAAHSIANYLIKLFIGARTAGFQWTFVQIALESNTDLVFYISMAALIWIFNRTDLQKSTRNFVGSIIGICVFQNVIYQVFIYKFALRSWWLLSAKVGFVSFLAMATLISYASVGNHATNANFYSSNF